MKRTITIILIIAVAVGLGYVYEKVLSTIEKKAYPLIYEEFVDKYAEEYGVPREIVYSIINTESNFKSNAESHKGAIGLMQITPDTFTWLMTKTGEKLAEGMLYDPQTNIKYGAYFLKYLFTEFETLDDNWNLVFAAYNAGLNRVKGDWMKKPEYIIDGKIVYIPFEETRNYIEKVNKGIETYRRLYFKEN